MRLFIAVNLAESQRRELGELQQQLQPYLERVRWVSPEKMHLTLKFLGEVEPGLVPQITAAMGRALSSSGVFYFKLKGLGVFPNPSRARVIWAGMEEGSREMEQLFTRLEAALVPLGFIRERRQFKPHLTLGRGSRPLSREAVARALTNKKGFITSPGKADRVTLYRSHLSRGGAEYEPLAEEYLVEGAGKSKAYPE